MTDKFSVLIPYVAVLEAAKELNRSKLIRVVLEVVLAFGNYMNRGARGNASGKKKWCQF